MGRIYTDLALEANEALMEETARRNAGQPQQQGQQQQGQQQQGQQQQGQQQQGQQQQGQQQQGQQQQQPGGQTGIEVLNSADKGVKVTKIRITNDEGARSIGKPIGTYITLEVPGLRGNDQELFENTCKVLAAQISSLLNLGDNSTILIIGLGNWNVTPDALGPKVVGKIMVTRHIHEYVPEQVKEGMRPVCAISPGVLGITGIETGEIVKGIVEKIKPDVVIAIDALASRKMDRVNTTIQIADTGISPGSGVGNKRMELSKDTLGVMVVAIGVPTVVDAATMANDTIDLVLDDMVKQAGPGTEFYKMLNGIDRDEKYTMIQQVLDPYVGNLIVTPKEIDEVVDRIAKVIANALNIALHKSVTMDDINRYLN